MTDILSVCENETSYRSLTGSSYQSGERVVLQGYIAPSWSWASVTTQVRIPSRVTPSERIETSLALIEIVDASVSPGLDDYGALRDG